MPGQSIDKLKLIEKGGSSASTFRAVIVTRPVAPTTALNVRRRDSHQRRIPPVLRTSAGAGKRTRVRADKRSSEQASQANLAEHPGLIKYFAMQREVDGNSGTAQR